MYRIATRRILLGLLIASLALLGFWSRRSVRAQEPDAVRLGRQEVECRIDDRHSLAVTTIRQELLNPTRDAAPGVCSLPISEEAALLRFRVLTPPLRKGEKEAERGHVSAAGRNSYQVECQVPPKGRAQFELTYAEALIRRGHRRKYAYPIPDPDSTPLPSALNVQVRIDAASAPQRVACASHSMSLRRPGPRSAQLTMTSNEPPDGRDLVVDYELPASAEDQRARLSVLTPADRNQDPYFLLTLPPPATLLHGQRTQEKPVDVVFCLDISGSTRGRKLDALQEAVHDGLVDLAPGDRFGVVAFDDDARAFHRTLTPAIPGSVSQAIRFLNRLRPAGGSNPGRGLQAALDILGSRPVAGRTQIVAILVDSDDPADLAATPAAALLRKRGVRLVALGALADSRLVTYRIRGRKLQSGPAIAMSRAAMTYGPSLSGAAFQSDTLNASYIYPPPERLPDLPLSTPVLLLGRLNEAPAARGQIRLTGKLEGVERELAVEYAWQPLEPGSPVPELWANRRIRRLKQLAEQDSSDSQELQTAACRVQEEHRLVVSPGG